MAAHVYSEIFLHYTWHVADDQPVLTAAVEPFVHNNIRNRCRQTKGVFFHEIGGTETHVHLAVQIEPFVCISEFIGDLKGANEFETNKHFNEKILIWQRGYGVVSFGKLNLPWVLAYIINQKEHHAKGSTVARLEMAEAFASPAEAGLKDEIGDSLPPPEGGV